MAIYKRKRKRGVVYQAKLRGSDGKWITKCFGSEREARMFESKLVAAVLSGQSVVQTSRQMTLNDFWNTWISGNQGEVTDGWRQSQIQNYNQYVGPVIGNLKLANITPADIKRVLNAAMNKGRAPATCRHIFSLLHKMFREAVEDHELIPINPVRKKFKPSLPEKESPHLDVNEVKQLLVWIRGKPYELAIWFGVYVGLRVGEIQALRWDCIDLEKGIVHVRSTYARKERIFREFPKGRKWHSPVLPPELLSLLKSCEREGTEFVCHSPRRDMLAYDGYLKALQRYCREAGIRTVATHGLRHSTAGLYLAAGATKDDLRELFAHSSSKVTDRYIHGKSERLEKVANVIRLFPEAQEGFVPQNVPQAHIEAGR